MHLNKFSSVIMPTNKTSSGCMGNLFCLHTQMRPPADRKLTRYHEHCGRDLVGGGAANVFLSA